MIRIRRQLLKHRQRAVRQAAGAQAEVQQELHPAALPVAVHRAAVQAAAHQAALRAAAQAAARQAALRAAVQAAVRPAVHLAALPVAAHPVHRAAVHQAAAQGAEVREHPGLRRKQEILRISHFTSAVQQLRLA